MDELISRSRATRSGDHAHMRGEAVNDTDRTGGIRNFAWVQPGKLARGEQPVEMTGAFAALRELGVSRVLSLRETGEGAGDVVGRWLPAYRPGEEEDCCRQAGMDFLQMPCRDGRAPDPQGLAAALAAIETSACQGKAIFVHCMAGVGRTGIVSAAWLLSQGVGGDDAAQHFLLYMDGMRSGDAARGVDQSGFWQGSAIRAQWWILQQVAIALGSPIGSGFPWLSPLQPAYARGWDEGYTRLLGPWRRSCSLAPCGRS